MKAKIIYMDDGTKLAIFTDFDGDASDSLKQDSALKFCNDNSVKNAAYFADVPSSWAVGGWQNI